jgi:hypothetical protein
MMGTVNDRPLLGHSLFRTGGLRTDGELRPVVLSSAWHQGDRVSKVLRPDGSVFTVTVPRLAMDDRTAHLVAGRRWISDDGGGPRLSGSGLVRLATAAGVAAH